MGTNIGVTATGDPEAVARITAKRGMTASAVMRKERARLRLLFGRGALYRADIMGGVSAKGSKPIILRVRVITRKGKEAKR